MTPGSCFFYLFTHLVISFGCDGHSRNAQARHYCRRAFSSCSVGAYFLVAMRGLLIAMASLVGSVVAAQGFSCSKACGIFPDQGSNLCDLL